MQRSRHVPVESAVPSGYLRPALGENALQTAHTTATRTGAFTLPKQRERVSAFTLAELVVTIGVLVVLVLLFTQLLNSTANITKLGQKQMDADSQAQQLLDRMEIDFAQMVKRPDVDYYVKSNPPLGGTPRRTVLQPGNDLIAFYSTVPAYFPRSNYQSPLSLVAYRVNSNSASSSYNRIERMGKGLLWNGAPSPSPTPLVTPTPTGTPTQVVFTPAVFIPIPLASPLPLGDLPSPTPNPLPTPAWPEASSAITSWSDSEVIGPQVFRFEYYYLLKDGNLSDVPWVNSTHSSVSGMQDVSAIVVDIAVIDSRSKELNNAQITTLAGQLVDYTSGRPAGWLRTQWQNTLDANTTLPRSAVSGIRLYERFIYVSPPVQ